MNRKSASVWAATLAAALVVTLAACTTPGGDTGGGPSTADGDAVRIARDGEIEARELDSWEPATRTDRLLLDIDASLAEGGSTLQQALDAYALSFGDIPGSTIADAPDEGMPLGDGVGADTALRMLRAHRGELSVEQLAALDAATGTPIAGAGTAITLPASTASAGAGVASVSRVPAAGPVASRAPNADEALRILRLADGAAQRWFEYRPDFLRFDPVILSSSVDYRVPESGQHALASATIGTTGPDPARPQCRITIYPAGIAAKQTDDQWSYVIAHELFHCIQDRWDGGTNDQATWIVEGSADWAMLDLFRHTLSTPPNIAGLTWFTDKTRPLAVASYDAWPLYETLRQMQGDPYATIRRLIELQASGTAYALHAARLDDPRFLMRASTAAVRNSQFPTSDPAWNLAWPSDSPGFGPHDTARAISLGIDLVTFEPQAAGEFLHPSSRLDFTGEVGLVTIVPSATDLEILSENGRRPVADGESVRYCLDPSGCRCPEGSASNAEQLDDLRSLVVALPMARTTGAFAVNAERWDERWCMTPKRETAGDWGDPHLATFDGLRFDMMTRGEFVVARDEQDGFEVQGRQEAVRGGTGVASGNSAIAIAVDGHRMTLTGDGFSLDAEVVTRVDGRVVGTDDFALGSARVVRDESDYGSRRWTVTLADGGTVQATWTAWFFVDLSFDAERASRLVGLLGSADGDASNDLSLPDGTVLPPDADLEDDWAQSWWVDDESSLFDYDAGRTPESYRGAAGDPAVLRGEEVDQCRDALGPRATEAEVSACAIDLIAAGLRAQVDAHRAVVDARLDLEDVEWVPVVLPATPTERPDPLPPAADARAGEPALVLAGTRAPFGSEPLDLGVVALREGATVVFRTDDCGADLSIRVEIGTVGDDRTPLPVSLCGPRIGFDNPSGATVDGEAYGFAGAAGDRTFVLRADGDDAGEVRVEVFVDPTPTIVDADDLTAGDGWQGTLSGIGDGVLLLPESETRVQEWDVSGFETACFNVAFGGGLDDDFWAIEPSCRHDASVRIGATGTAPLPILLFSRTPGRAEVALRAR
ncbi:VWD domain-containing protein [Agromyces sp. MMS24-JH15]|uniref:VWD domain-containing protein n=1 Tax=Agromyces sp. MMS24-JH15 TaxID=3243765 RepID=UPI00374A8AE0